MNYNYSFSLNPEINKHWVTPVSHILLTFEYFSLRRQICLGGEVPRDYYKSIEQCVDPSRLTQVTVAAGSKLDLDVMVTEPNSVLRFEHFFYQYDF